MALVRPVYKPRRGFNLKRVGNWNFHVMLFGFLRISYHGHPSVPWNPGTLLIGLQTRARKWTNLPGKFRARLMGFFLDLKNIAFCLSQEQLPPTFSFLGFCFNERKSDLFSQILLCTSDSELTASDIACIGLATQRGTFITWDKKTAKPFHNFIVWKDIRAEKMVQNFNTSLPAVVCKHRFIQSESSIYCYLSIDSKKNPDLTLFFIAGFEGSL